MEQNKKALLTEQANKIAEIVKVLRTQFGEDFEDEVNYLEIVKKELETPIIFNPIPSQAHLWSGLHIPFRLHCSHCLQAL